jgi:predicted acyltransferase
MSAPAIATVERPRLLSLDVFRGFNILIMIVVNCCGPGSFVQLQHSAWNGWTLTDLVFPFFLFITGVSLTFSFAGRLQGGSPAGTGQPMALRSQTLTGTGQPMALRSQTLAGTGQPMALRSQTLAGTGQPMALRSQTHWRLLPHIVRRAATIFAIGLLINAFPHYHLATWRIPGVLQRIALCYLVGSVLYLWSGARTRWAVIAALLVGYWILMRYVPVPGFGIPTVHIPLLDPDRNLAAWLDRKLMMGHLYERVRDPEGLLSTLPALVSTLFGIAAGEWIRALRGDAARLLRRLLAVGVACFVAGELWGLSFPINKKLWTSSYVLLTAGLAMMALAACYWLMDVKKVGGRWTIIPLVFGTNCIFAYAFSEFAAISLVVAKIHLDGRLMSYKEAFNSFTFDHIPGTQWSELGYALFYTAFCWFFTWQLYRRRIFLKV